MAQPKLMLPFGPEAMLARVARLLTDAVDHVAVVAGVDQPLPELPAGVLVLRDRSPGQGPLEGIAVGLRALQPLAEIVFVAGCDMPLVSPDFVRRMIGLAQGFDVAVAHVCGIDQPLAAVYHASVLPIVEQLRCQGRRAPASLLDLVRTRRVPAEELRDVDPELLSLRNVNTPQEYVAALGAAGFPRPLSEKTGA